MADAQALDAYVIGLGRAGVAVRRLERRERSLESLFLQLTGHGIPREESAPALRDSPDGPRSSTVAT